MSYDLNRLQKGKQRVLRNLELQKEKEDRSVRFGEIANPTLKHKTVDLLDSPTRGNATLVMQYYDPKNIKSIFVKYHDIAKRKFF